MTQLCTVLDVMRANGIYEQVDNESVGTGDGTTTVFNLDFTRVVDDSELIYVNGTIQTQGVNYNIVNNLGKITFTSAPSSSATIVAFYKYFVSQHTNEDIENFIGKAQAEIENWTGKKFTSTSYTEWHEGRNKTISASGDVTFGYGDTVRNKGTWFSETDEDKYMIQLDNYPVSAVTSLDFMDDDGSTSDESLTQNEDFHLWPEKGMIWIFTSSIPEGGNKRKVKVVYTAYDDTITEEEKELCALIASVQLVVSMTGGSFNDITHFQIGDVDVTVGEPWTQLSNTFDKMQKRIDFLFDIIGRKIRMVGI